MTAVTAAGAATTSRPTGQRLARILDRWLLPIYAGAATAYLILPVAVMILFSFNDPTGRSNLNFRQFSLDAWLNPLGRPGLGDAVLNSLIIAAIATLVSTILGTMIALALVRYGFRGRNATNLLIFLPMSTPEIVLGASLLTSFIASVQLPFVPEGLLYPLSIRTIVIAHIMFNISYVVVTVKARLTGFPRHLEEAAMDLGATEWTTFWKVTFPLIRPGIIAAALLAFSLSIDDFIVTNFTSGNLNTFPVWVWGTIRNNLPPQVHVIGSAIFLLAVSAVAISSILSARGQRPAAVPR